MNTYAVMVQSHAMSAMGTWLVIGLSMACFACALILSREANANPESPLAKLAVAALVALVLVTVASSTTYAYIYVPCTDPAGVPWYWFLIWGC